jgi:hypothetical protein
VIVLNCYCLLCIDLLTFFRAMYGSSVIAAVLMRDTRALDALVAERKEVVARLQDAHDAWDHSGTRPRRWSCVTCRRGCGCCCDKCCEYRACPQRVDAVSYWTEELERLNEAIDKEQRKAHPSMLTAFVTFSSARAVTWATQVNHSAVPVRPTSPCRLRSAPLLIRPSSLALEQIHSVDCTERQRNCVAEHDRAERSKAWSARLGHSSFCERWLSRADFRDLH